MGRIFISAGHGGIRDGRRDPGAIVDGVVEAQEMISLRDLVVQHLRSRNYEVLSVPDDLNLTQTVEWINSRSRVGDVALELHADAVADRSVRGASVFYIANNDQRKVQAEQLLQIYLRRVPQMPSRGAKPDTQTAVGRLAFCRQVVIPSLLMEVGFLTSAEDRRILQSQRQEIAFGIAEGLANWNRILSPNPAVPPLLVPSYPPVDLIVNGASYDDKGILVEGNAYIPIDLVDQLGIDLPVDAPVRRISYRNIVFVRAIDLREFNLSVNPVGNHSISLRSAHAISPEQMQRIMGRGSTSEVQMMMFLKSHNPDGLARFSDLPKLYREEASIEGVNYDLAFAQMCVETNFLRFGGDVKPEQNNFAGLGAIGGGTEGATFTDPRIGIRAQIQHLKAYASTEPLVQAIVDPRFSYVRRGVAPLLAQLSGRWAADLSYHKKILSVLKRLYESAGFL